MEIKNSHIKFENVSFKYTEEEKEKNILTNVDLEILGGKMTALVGLSGAGKSTILNLIPRFYNSNDGDIKIDGQSIYDLKINSLREQISLVSQDTTLFDDTIKNNISYANLNATMDEIMEAAKNSFAIEFINNYQKDLILKLEKMVLDSQEEKNRDFPLLELC